MPCPEKFCETLVEYGVAGEIIAKIDCGYEKIVSKSLKKGKSPILQIRALDNRKQPQP